MIWAIVNALCAALNGYHVFHGDFPIASLCFSLLNATVCGACIAVVYVEREMR